MDRWNIVTTLNYLALEKEMEIVLSKNKNMNNAKGKRNYFKYDKSCSSD